MEPSDRRSRLDNRSLWIQFFTFSILFAVGNYVLIPRIRSDLSYTWWSAAIAGIIFGTLMTLGTWLRRLRYRRMAGTAGTVGQMIELQTVVTYAKLPSDPELLKVLPVYLDDQLNMARRLRFWGVIEFVLLAALGLGVTISNRSVINAIITLTFIGFMIYTLKGTQTKLAHITQLQAALKAQS